MKQRPELNFYYLGESYPLYTKLDPTMKKLTIKWDGKAFLCSGPQEGEIDISNALHSFYIKASRKLIEERLKLYQKYFKVKYKSFSIENHKDKWGSCSSNKHLTFHWRLILFPIDVIDYVVVHELCHLVHMNHDRSFWRLVGKIHPRYKESMDILGTKNN